MLQFYCDVARLSKISFLKMFTKMGKRKFGPKGIEVLTGDKRYVILREPSGETKTVTDPKGPTHPLPPTEASCARCGKWRKPLGRAREQGKKTKRQTLSGTQRGTITGAQRAEWAR